MKRVTRIGAVVLAGIVLAGVSLPVLIAGDPMQEYVPVEVRVLKQSPEKFVGVGVRLEGMFHSIENLWAPFFTPFVREDYMVFSLWPYDAEVWTRKGRLDDLPTCFLRKSDRQLKVLLGLKPYAPVEVRGTVVSDFHKLPWIEVTSIQVIGEPRYTPEEIRALVRSVPEPVAEPESAPEAPAPGGKPAASPKTPVGRAPTAPDAARSREAALERALASKDAEAADLRRQLDSARAEASRLSARCAEMDKIQREVEKSLQEREKQVQEGGKVVQDLKSQNEALTKRVGDLEGLLRRIFGSLDAATEKLKDLDKQKGARRPGVEEPVGQEPDCSQPAQG